MCGGMDFTEDGGIIIAASTNSFDMIPPKGEGFVIKTDENSNTMWQQTFGYEIRIKFKVYFQQVMEDI